MRVRENALACLENGSRPIRWKAARLTGSSFSLNDVMAALAAAWAKMGARVRLVSPPPAFRAFLVVARVGHAGRAWMPGRADAVVVRHTRTA